MKQEFKLSKKSQIRALYGLMHSTIVWLALLIVFYFLFEKEILFIALSIASLYLIFDVLPVLILNINYLKYAKNIAVVLKENTMIINDKAYTSDEIDQIEIYATIQHVKKTAGAYTLSHNEYYYYIAIDLKEGETIVLNSLLGQDLDEALEKAFPDTKIKYTYSFFSRLMITENSFSKERV